jgi:hypothetical protein
LERSRKKLERAVKKANCVKEGYLMWSEFLDFFFCKEDTQFRVISKEPKEWWLNIDIEGHRVRHAEDTPVKSTHREDSLTSSQRKEEHDRAAKEKEENEVKMTPALELLVKSRRIRTEQEVEEEFKKSQKLLLQQASVKDKSEATAADKVDESAL